MIDTEAIGRAQEEAFMIHVEGLVQGVGFRPTAWNLAQRYHLRGRVLNTRGGMEILAAGSKHHIEQFVSDLTNHPPPLARITAVSMRAIPLHEVGEQSFLIADSTDAEGHTGIVPDAATCHECLKETFDPFSRRFRYPFTTCTHCGPRLTIQEHIPFDRPHTTMKYFPMCSDCLKEYEDPADRRFHAQSIACPACGPKAWIEQANGKLMAIHASNTLDEVDACCTLLQEGYVLAIKGLGGFQLACDATQEQVVERLRRLKRREGKPFALMARDLNVIRQYCPMNDEESELLQSPAAPIVILSRLTGSSLAPSVAPGMNTYGFMLPNTPLHHLLLRRIPHPIVLTSGNMAGEPQWIDNAEAMDQLRSMADFFLLHNRDIARRIDDSVVRVMNGEPRMLRRSRGYAPAPLPLPKGFEQAPALLAMGGELKNTFCLLQDGQALMSHHIGDLEDACTYKDYQQALAHYQEVFTHTPETIVIDPHPNYLSSALGREYAASNNFPLIEVQHHHAHFAACLADNDVPFETSPVFGVILDGLGYGDDGTLWGGEFLLGNYERTTRIGTFKPVPMLGGIQAIKEPWRNTYAHLKTGMGWDRVAHSYHHTSVFQYLEPKPRAILDQMLAKGINSPMTSSCGRLFDAAAAAMGICPDEVAFEGQAAMELEALLDVSTLLDEDEALAYPFAISPLPDSHLPAIDPLPMWHALLNDLQCLTPVPIMAARFHKGLAQAIAAMVIYLTKSPITPSSFQTVALSGGVFQNRVLFELLKPKLEHAGFTVLFHRRVPTNDGGLALGQAMVAAARTLNPFNGGHSSCA
jgi:hydrogenase maturation protein HypF